MTKRMSKLLLTFVICTGISFSAAAAGNVADGIGAPAGVLVTSSGDILVTDTYHKVIWNIRDGSASVYAGSISVRGLYGEPIGGYYDGTSGEALFMKPWAIVPFLDGYAVSDSANNVVRLIGSGATRTVAGGSGTVFQNPTGLAVDELGNLYVADTNNGCIRMVTPSGQVKMHIDGLNEPTALFYQERTLYIAETGNHRLLSYQNGQLTVLAGGRDTGYADGAAAEALFSNPQGITVSTDGVIYIADTGNAAVRKLQNGMVTTLLSNPAAAMASYPVSPMGLAVSGDQLLICDNFAQKLITIER